MAESATVIGISSPSLNDSCPLSFEGIQLEENPPFNVAEKFSQVAQVSQKVIIYSACAVQYSVAMVCI